MTLRIIQIWYQKALPWKQTAARSLSTHAPLRAIKSLCEHL